MSKILHLNLLLFECAAHLDCYMYGFEAVLRKVHKREDEHYIFRKTNKTAHLFFSLLCLLNDLHKACVMQ